MQAVRDFLETPAGKAVGIGLAVVAGLLFWFSLRKNLVNEAAALSKDRVMMCSETGKSFKAELGEGSRIPVKSPHSGKNTGYPAEFCYWTKDGQIKQEPTLVLLNQHAGKKPPTFCPDCGRLVTPLNPIPSTGMRPPPTQAEVAQRTRREP